MRKITTLARLIPALLLGATVTGWLPTVLAQEAPSAATAPAAEAAAPASEAAAEALLATEPPAAGAAAPAAETAAPATEETEAAPETTEAEAAGEKPATRSRYGYRANYNRMIEQRKAMMKQRREQLDRWHSWRRWMDNPAAEDRRMWNKARSQMYRDMAEARREYYEQNRPDYRSYEYYPGGGYGYYEEWDYPNPWGGRW